EAEFVDLALAAAGQLDHAIEIVTIADEPVPDHTPYSALLGEGAELPALAWTVEDELAPLAINYTSGTTGRPKGVMYSHRGAYLNSMGFLQHAGFTQQTRYLWTLPMFHCNGWCAPWAITAASALQ